MRSYFILLKLIMFLTINPIHHGAGWNYYWKPTPRHFLITTEAMVTVPKPRFINFHKGKAVLLEGYTVGLSVLALAEGWQKFRGDYPHFDPTSAWFYTSAYRWLLRHLSLIPDWFKSDRQFYMDTQKLWRRRFYFVEAFMPKWMRRLLPHVVDWKMEKRQFKQYLRYAEPAFAKHYHYPGPVYSSKWYSELTSETVENLDISDFSAYVKEMGIFSESESA